MLTLMLCNIDVEILFGEEKSGTKAVKLALGEMQEGAVNGA